MYVYVAYNASSGFRFSYRHVAVGVTVLLILTLPAGCDTVSRPRRDCVEFPCVFLPCAVRGTFYLPIELDFSAGSLNFLYE